MATNLSDDKIVSILENSQKIGTSEFLKYISKQSGIDIAELRVVYKLIVNGIIDLVCKGNRIMFREFGVFSLKLHKGHPVQFEQGNKRVDGYVILKFAASDILTERIRKNYKSILSREHRDRNN